MNDPVAAPQEVSGAQGVAAANAGPAIRLNGYAASASRHAAVLIALIVIALIGWHGSDVFFTSNNLTNLIQQVSGIGIVAVGMTVLMIAGEIDLSVGSAVSLISVFVAHAVGASLNSGVVILEAVGIGLGVGLLLGIIIAYTGAPAFMVTLGALSVLLGISAQMTQNSDIVITGFTTLGTAKFHGIPICFLVLVVVNAALWLVLYRTTLGRSVFAVGGHREAARLAGIPVTRVQIAAFAINGALVGLGACVMASNVGSGGPDLGTNLELQVITAVVIGGATLSGGHGSLAGTFLGVLLLGAISNVLTLLGAAPYVAEIVFGGFIAFTVCLRGTRTVDVTARYVAAVKELARFGPRPNR